MSFAFSPSAPEDLIVPREGASTARALVSFAARSLFEQRARLLDPLARDGGAHAALSRWLAIVDGMLPGRPHVIARSLRDPALSIPARALLAGGGDHERAARSFVGSALFWLELEGLLEAPIELPFEVEPRALGQRSRALAPTRTLGADTRIALYEAVFGHLLAVDARGPWVGLGYVRGQGEPDSEWMARVREALARLSRLCPPMRAEVDRLAYGFVRGVRVTSSPPLALLCVPSEGTIGAIVDAISDELVAEKLALLRLADPLADPYPQLEALAKTRARLHLALRHARASGEDTRAQVEALEALREQAASYAAQAEVSTIGAGIVRELCT